MTNEKWQRLYTWHKLLRTIRSCTTKTQLDNLEKYISEGCDKLEIDEKKDVMEEWYDKLIEIRRKEDG